MCAHRVFEVTLPRIQLRNCDANFINQLYRRYPPNKHEGGMLFLLRVVPLLLLYSVFGKFMGEMDK